MLKKHVLSIVVIFLFSLTSVFVFAENAPVQIKHTDKCAVCGMFVAKYNNWIAQIIFKDGSYAVFDGPKDMFRYYHNLSKYNPSKSASDISAIYVTEYYSVKIMDAKKMFFVQDSDVLGPMGHEFIPVSSEEKAKEFLKDHNGKKIFRFNEITAEMIRSEGHGKAKHMH